MNTYARRGELPAKPHTVFLQPDGTFYYEHCFTQGGFDGPFSILYHRHPPQNHGGAEAIDPAFPLNTAAGAMGNAALRRRHLRTDRVSSPATPTPATPTPATPLRSRVPLLYNKDLTIGFVRPTADDDRYFINGDDDELFFCHAGGGVLYSWFGTLRFGAGDYLFIPRSTLYRMVLDRDTDGAVLAQRWLWIACNSGMHLPTQYRNPIGQLRMDAPYTPRDFRLPELTHDASSGDQTLADERGGYTVITKRSGRFSQHRWPHPPLDVVGWDGTVYPFVFPILNFQAKAGAVHLPPTVHGTFASGGSLICSFVPRTVDFGKNAIPCPYPHSNVDVEEVIFYCDGDFTSRRGVDAGSITYHPAGIPHGPHRGAYEGSVGVREVGELAVMIDSFDAFTFTPQGAAIEQPGYDESWWPAVPSI